MSARERPAAFYRATELFAERVRARRLELGLTQEKLAERAGMSRNQVQNIERNRNNTPDPETGRRGPGNARLDTVFLLAEALDVSASFLVSLDETDRPY